MFRENSNYVQERPSNPMRNDALFNQVNSEKLNFNIISNKKSELNVDVMPMAVSSVLEERLL